jgi:oligoribonuclease (3'-5' exoribonuclease)
VIIEIAVIITDGELVPIDDGINYVIKTDKRLLDGMDEWCTRTHGVSPANLLSFSRVWVSYPAITDLLPLDHIFS